MPVGCRFQEYKPATAMVVVQIIFVMASLTAKSLFAHGTSPMVFIVYRQAIATLVMLPTALLARGKKMALGVWAFGLVFATSLIGCSLNQWFFYQGLKMTSSSMASAMNNIIPAITFVLAASVGLEKVNFRSIRSIGKILGTIICVSGAVSMALFKGPKLLGVEYFHTLAPMLVSVNKEWVMGCLILLAGTCCQSLWLILQVPICERYLDPLSLSAWMCILSTFQSATITYVLEPNLQVWKINSLFEIFSIMYIGIFASGVTFWLQSWVISIRGPVFSALFSPVQTVIATIAAFLLLNEELRIGSLLGATAVMAGLYIVLWGKAKDLDKKSNPNPTEDFAKVTISNDVQGENGGDDLKEPLLSERSSDLESQMSN